MKKVLLLLTLCMLLALSSCGGNSGSSSSSASPDASSEFVGEKLPEDFAAPKADAELLDAVKTLVEQDAAVLDIYFNHSLDAVYGDLVEGTAESGYYEMKDVVTFETMSDIERFVKGTYATEEAQNYFLFFPNEQYPLYKGDDQSLLMHNAEAIGFRAFIDVETIEIVEQTDDQVTFSFTYLEPDYWLDPSTMLPTPNNQMTMSRVGDHWKLDRTFYLYYKEINVSPIKP